MNTQKNKIFFVTKAVAIMAYIWPFNARKTKLSDIEFKNAGLGLRITNKIRNSFRSKWLKIKK